MIPGATRRITKQDLQDERYDEDNHLVGKKRKDLQDERYDKDNHLVGKGNSERPYDDSQRSGKGYAKSNFPAGTGNTDPYASINADVIIKRARLGKGSGTTAFTAMKHIKTRDQLDEHRNRLRRILKIRTLERSLDQKMPHNTINDMLMTTRHLTREQIANDLAALMQKAGFGLADIIDCDRLLITEYDDEHMDKIIKSDKYIELSCSAQESRPHLRTVQSKPTLKLF